MSGTPGATYVAKYYYVSLDSGLSISVEPPPDCKDPDQYIGNYFKEESAVYERWLEKSKSDIDAVFQAAVSVKKLPIVEYSENAPWKDGAIIEDGNKSMRPDENDPKALIITRLRKQNMDKMKPCQVEFRFSVGNDKTHGEANFRMTIRAPARRTDIERLQEELSAVLVKHLEK